MSDTLRIGLDLGSTAIKAVLVEKERLIWRGMCPTVPGQESVATSLIEEGLSSLGLDRGAVSGITSTGYGKKLFTASDKHVDEITANGLGAFMLSGGRARTVINVGGQDLKILFLDGSGRVTDFKMNDKCAAGTGRFFELAARILDTPLADFAHFAAASTEDIELNNTCVVFAESEIVSLLAKGVKKEDVIRALHYSVARRVAGLLGRFAAGGVYLDGGPAANTGLSEALSDELMTEINVLDEPQFTVAYGAAIRMI
jgi:predicted CoA-substrate-specific enzyme activase